MISLLCLIIDKSENELLKSVFFSQLFQSLLEASISKPFLSLLMISATTSDLQLFLSQSLVKLTLYSQAKIKSSIEFLGFGEKKTSLECLKFDIRGASCFESGTAANVTCIYIGLIHNLFVRHSICIRTWINSILLSPPSQPSKISQVLQLYVEATFEIKSDSSNITFVMETLNQNQVGNLIKIGNGFSIYFYYNF